jgi:hypothetical protein
MFTLYADGCRPSDYCCRETAIASGKALGVESFEVWDETTETVVYSERPECSHLRFGDQS